MNPTTDNSPPTAQTAYGDDADSLSSEDQNWLRIARSAFVTSTSYMDSNHRKIWEDSIRAFNNQHASDSKYTHPSYDKRSRLFRPKTRSIIRKNEAAAAAAFFSSLDVTSVEPMDPNNKEEMASAQINKAILNYRLTKTIPWYQIVLGGLQDAQNVGVACAHIYWDFKPAKNDKKGQEEAKTNPAHHEQEYPSQPITPPGSMVAMGAAEGDPSQPPADPSAPLQPQTAAQGPEMSAGGPPPMQPVVAPPPPVQPPKKKEYKPIVDKPVVDLIPVENLRIDPGANWMDPIGTSPFIIHLIPMYMMDVKSEMEAGRWHRYGDGALRAACATTYDSTRAARQNNKEDPYMPQSNSFTGYEICWVQRHIHRKDDEDWEFYTLGDFALLSKPRLLSKVVFHGKRPYVMGCCILESHKVYPSSVGQLGKGLQEEANEISNQRIDNVKFVLNKKWFAKRGKDVDIGGLVRNVPGGVVMMDDPEKDVREISWPDVTASSYEEQSRIDNDMNDLLGNFSAGQVMADHGINSPARNMAMLGQSAGTLVEYLLRTYVETFVQPVLRQILLLEQEYETDKTVLSLASTTSKLYQKFGIDEVTDELLEKELNLTVNVGMGATDPQLKLQKFTFAMSSYLNMLQIAPPGVNMAEVGKEIFGHMGYQDGSRFLDQDNPQLLKLQQQVQQDAQVIQGLQQKLADKQTAELLKYKTSAEANQTKITTTQMQQDNENLRNATTHLRAITEAKIGAAVVTREGNLDRMHQRAMREISDVNHVAEPRSMKG